MSSRIDSARRHQKRQDVAAQIQFGREIPMSDEERWTMGRTVTAGDIMAEKAARESDPVGYALVDGALLASMMFNLVLQAKPLDLERLLPLREDLYAAADAVVAHFGGKQPSMTRSETATGGKTA